MSKFNFSKKLNLNESINKKKETVLKSDFIFKAAGYLYLVYGSFILISSIFIIIIASLNFQEFSLKIFEIFDQNFQGVEGITPNQVIYGFFFSLFIFVIFSGLQIMQGFGFLKKKKRLPRLLFSLSIISVIFLLLSIASSGDIFTVLFSSYSFVIYAQLFFTWYVYKNKEKFVN